MSASTGTTVAVLVAALVLLGLAMIGVAVWLVRATRTDPGALGPLEVLGSRRWRKSDEERRRQALDAARPPGAPPPAPMVPFEVTEEPASNGEVEAPVPPTVPAGTVGTTEAAEPSGDPTPEAISTPEDAADAETGEAGGEPTPETISTPEDAADAETGEAGGEPTREKISTPEEAADAERSD